MTSPRPFFFLAMDKFCQRQFNDPTYLGTRIPDKTSDAFLSELTKLGLTEAHLVDGYAPFCKHLFIANFTRAVATTAAITAENAHLLRSGYKARTDAELPVLVRWFPKGALGPDDARAPARFLDLILYSREQCVKENVAMGAELAAAEAELGPEPWRVISVKAQDVDFELPMTPITAMRNAIISEGGSGVAIDRKKYKEAVDYWEKHATIE